MAYPIAVEDLIPHRDRMKLIDDIVDITAEQAITQAVVSERWPLVQDGAVDPLVLVELVAQTAAVQVSWQIDGAESGATGGLLAGIKNADFLTDRIPLKTILTTTVSPLYSAEGYTVLEGTVRAEERILGRVEIQVIRIDRDQMPGLQEKES
jgi:predicted hotdog family 3-hydroxylacyl-ACP dehydratase